MPDEVTANDEAANAEKDSGKPSFSSWDDFLAAQDETIKGLHEKHVSGLKSALDAERKQREKVQRDLNEAIRKLEKGSETRAELERMQSDNEEHIRKLSAYEALYAAGVKNVKLAYLAAKDGDYFDSKGNLRVENLKADNPELFAEKKPAPRGNPGIGTADGVKVLPMSMSDWIRKEAGR